jgi:hypothetical protein
MVSTMPAWGMEPTTSSLGAMSPYHQAKARGAFVLASPNMEAKVPTFQPQETIKIWLIIIKIGGWLFCGTCVESWV